MDMVSSVAACWPNWKILETLDSGCIGSVFRAVHCENPNLQSAIKIVHIPTDNLMIQSLRAEGKTDDQIKWQFSQLVEKYCQEVRKMAMMKGSHHIVSIEDYAVSPCDDGLGYVICIRMELLKPLSDYLCDKQLSEEEVLDIGIDITDALICCHKAGILHLDIKPENLFVDDRQPSGVLYKLGDFSAAREIGHADAVQPTGTLAYIPPEIMDHHKADVRSDLYSLGLTLYQMLNCGNLPFLSERLFHNPDEKEIAIKTRLSGVPLPPPADASKRVAKAVGKACAYDPDQRYASAVEMNKALSRVRRTKRDAQKFLSLPARWGVVSVAVIMVLIAVCLAALPSAYPGSQVPAVTELPLLDAEARDSSRYYSCKHLLAELGEEFEKMDLLPQNDAGARIPRSLAFFSAFSDQLNAFLPEWSLDLTGVSPTLSINDPCELWNPILYMQDRSTYSLSRRSDGLYLPYTATANECPVSLWLHCATAEISCSFGFDISSHVINEINLAYRNGDVSLVLEDASDPQHLHACLNLYPKGLPKISAVYGADGVLQYVSSNQKTYQYETSLEKIEGVDLLP